MSSTVHGIRELNPDFDDIIVNIDGDDALYLTTALEIIDYTYARTNCLIMVVLGPSQRRHNADKAGATLKRLSIVVFTEKLNGLHHIFELISIDLVKH